MKSILKSNIGKANSLMIKNRLYISTFLVLVLSASIGIGVYKSNAVATKNTQEKVSKEKVLATKVEKQDDKKIKESKNQLKKYKLKMRQLLIIILKMFFLSQVMVDKR